MNSHKYKEECMQPSAFRVSELQETLEILQRNCLPEAEVVAYAIANGRIAKPEHYSGKESDEFCRVNCSAEQAEVIVDALFIAEAGAVTKAGKTTPEASRWATLVDRWSRLSHVTR